MIKILFIFTTIKLEFKNFKVKVFLLKEIMAIEKDYGRRMKDEKPFNSSIEYLIKFSII